MPVRYYKRVRIQVYVRPREYNYMVKVCKQYGQSASEFCRLAILRELQREQQAAKEAKGGASK